MVVPPNPIYNPQAAETDCYRIGANFLFRQHATQLLPVFHPHDGIFSYAGASITEPVYPSGGSPGHIPSPSAAPSHDYEFGYAMVATVCNFVPACSPYKTGHSDQTKPLPADPEQLNPSQRVPGQPVATPSHLPL